MAEMREAKRFKTCGLDTEETNQDSAMPKNAPRGMTGKSETSPVLVETVLEDSDIEEPEKGETETGDVPFVFDVDADTHTFLSDECDDDEDSRSAKTDSGHLDGGPENEHLMESGEEGGGRRSGWGRGACSVLPTC